MKTLNLQITSNCDMNCKFCSDLFKYQKERKVSEILSVIDKTPNGVIEKIVITGGEPLLYPDLFTLVKEIKTRGFQVSLSTNGTLLNDNKNILTYLDEITLPVDSGLSEKLEEMGRDKLQLLKTVKNIALLKDINPNIRIKISTVLNKKNIDEIDSLVMIMDMLYLDEWEVHQFLPHGNGKSNIREFLLGDVEFEKAISFLETTTMADKLTPISVCEKLEDGWLLTPCMDLVKLIDNRAASYGSALKLDGSTFDSVFKRKSYCKIM